MTKNQKSFDIGILILRIALGGYMLAAAISKVQGEINNGFGSFYSGSFTKMKPDWLPSAMAMPYGYSLPWLELVVGIALIVGFYTRIISLIGLVMLASFTIALVIFFDTLAAQPAAAGGPFNANYIQCAAYLFFALVGGGRWSVDAFLPKNKKS